MEWYDPPMCKRSTKIIPGLLKRINRQDEEIKRLSMKLKSKDAGFAKEAQWKAKCCKRIFLVCLIVVVFVVVSLKISKICNEVGWMQLM